MLSSFYFFSPYLITRKKKEKVLHGARIDPPNDNYSNETRKIPPSPPLPFTEVFSAPISISSSRPGEEQPLDRYTFASKLWTQAEKVMVKRKEKANSGVPVKFSRCEKPPWRVSLVRDYGVVGRNFARAESDKASRASHRY